MITRRVLPNDRPQIQKDLKFLDSRVEPGSSLKLGATGRAVEIIQSHLKAAGLYTGPVNGTFDAATEAAVKALQTKSKLPPTGIVGQGTVKAIRSINLFVKDGSFTTAARGGQRGKDILRMEQKLEKLGLNTGKVDGVYDADTKKAVLAYKKLDKQLKPETGVVGNRFYKELSEAAKSFDHKSYRGRDTTDVAQHKRLDEQTKARIAKTGAISSNDKGRAIDHIRQHLRAAGFGRVLGGGETLGRRGAAAVKAFQKAEGLAQTGEVDAKTWARLSSKSFAAKDGTSPAQGLQERSGAVLRTEKLLKKLGYKGVKVDGLYDARTQKAVKAFQKKHDMTVTGQVGAPTLSKIQKAVKAGGNSQFVNRLLNLARSQLGVHEQPMGSNRQKYSTFFGRPPEAWCADFVSWCYTKSGKKLNIASTSVLLDYFHKNGTFHANNPKPGDIIIYDWTQGDSDLAEHTGIVEKVFKKDGRWYMQTIEGNWGDRVARKVVPLSDVDIRGFGNVK